MALFGVSTTTFNTAIAKLQAEIDALKAKDIAQDSAQKWSINPNELKAALDASTVTMTNQITALKASIAALPAPFDPAPFQTQADALKAQVDDIKAQLVKLNAFMTAAYKDDPNVINLNTFPPTV